MRKFWYKILCIPELSCEQLVHLFIKMKVLMQYLVYENFLGNNNFSHVCTRFLLLLRKFS